MKAGDEYFICDPHNGDISGSVSGALSFYCPLLRCALPAAAGASASGPRLPSFSAWDPIHLLSPSLPPERGEEGEGEAAQTRARERGIRNGYKYLNCSEGKSSGVSFLGFQPEGPSVRQQTIPREEEFSLVFN